MTDLFLGGGTSAGRGARHGPIEAVKWGSRGLG